MANEYRANRHGLRQLLTSYELQRGLKPHAARIEARAKATAEVETPQSAAAHGRIPGKFERSIHQEDHRSKDRRTVRVVADCEGAGPIEARFHTLGRAAG